MCAHSGPTPAPTPVPDPDHPHDGKVLTLYNTFDNGNNYVSFAYTDAPAGEPSGSVAKTWLRKGYTDTNDAMPLRFDAVKGKKNQYKVSILTQTDIHISQMFTVNISTVFTNICLHAFCDVSDTRR